MKDLTTVQVSSKLVVNPATKVPELLHRNEELGTLWGPIKFNKDGQAVAKLPQAGIDKLKEQGYGVKHEIDAELAQEHRVENLPKGPVNYATLYAQLELRHAELVIAQADMQRENERLRSQMDEVHGTGAGAQLRIEELTKNFNALRGELDQQQADNRLLTAQLGEAESVRRERAEALAEIDALKAKLAASNSGEAEAALQQDLVETKKQLVKTQSKLEKAQAKIAELKGNTEG